MNLRTDIITINENPHLVLDKGEKICNKCKGWGYKIKIEIKKSIKYECLTLERCSRCLGRCTLEFIDAVMGQNNDSRWK